MDAFVKGLDGTVQMLVDTDVTRNQKIDDNEKSVTVTARGTPLNARAFNLIEPLAQILYDGDIYIVLKPTLGLVGQTVVKTFTADHKFYDDMATLFVATKYQDPSKVWQRDTMISMIFDGSGYTPHLDATGLASTWTTENEDDTWGWDNRAALLSDFCTKFGTEYKIAGTDVYLAKQLGVQTNAQFRFKVNVASPTVDLDASALFTYIQGFGHQFEDGTYEAQTDYTSPLAEKYGKREMTPIVDDNAHDVATLLAELVAALTDSINVTVTLTHVNMKQLNIDAGLGDSGYVILEPFNLAVPLRVMEIEDYKAPKPALYTFGVIKQKMTDIMAGLAIKQQSMSTDLTKVGQIAAQSYDSRIILDAPVGEVDD
ncbi:MAG: prophage endopeptidase tail family protein [Sporolactobacillus sp.]